MNNPKIKFGDKDFYIVDFFKYKGIKYYYIVEDTYKEGMDVDKPSGEIEINFIYECQDGKYENVVSDELFKELQLIAARRMQENKNPFMK